MLIHTKRNTFVTQNATTNLFPMYALNNCDNEAKEMIEMPQFKKFRIRIFNILQCEKNSK